MGDEYRLQEVHFSEQGMVRQGNQDAVMAVLAGSCGVFCVADGMGGHANGQQAAKMIVGGIHEYAAALYDGKYEKGFAEAVEDFEERLKKVNREIYDTYNVGQICGAALVALLIYGGYYAVFSLGDSRVYRRRGGHFLQLTRDDNWQNREADHAKLTKSEIVHSVDYNKLSAAFGVTESVLLNIQTDRLQDRDVFFLCSDGVYRYCERNALKRACRLFGWFRNQPMKTSLGRVKKRVYQCGAPDNLTAVLVKAEIRKDI